MAGSMLPGLEPEQQEITGSIENTGSVSGSLGSTTLSVTAILTQYATMGEKSVVFCDSFAVFPPTGETTCLYVDMENGAIYRWEYRINEYIPLTGKEYPDADREKLSHIDPYANNYIHPETHPASIIMESSDRVFFTDLEKQTLLENQNNIISNIDELQTALNGKLGLTGGTMTGDIIFNNLQLDPGNKVYPSRKFGFKWSISSDSAGMQVFERGNDMLDYVFTMSDNPNSVDRYLWKETAWTGTHGDIEAMEIYPGNNMTINQQVSINGKLSLKAPRLAAVKRPSRLVPANAFADVTIVRNNQNCYDPDIGLSVLDISVDVTGYTGSTSREYIIKIKDISVVPNTFCWGHNAAGYDVLDTSKWSGIDVPVGTDWITLDSGVKIKFNSNNGGVANETFGFTVLPGSALDVKDTRESTFAGPVKVQGKNVALTDANGNLEAPGIVAIINKVNVSTTLATTYNIILADASNSPITLSLPVASTASGKEYKIKKIDNSNFVTINTNGTETIDGETSYVIKYQHQAIHLVCDGMAWYIM